jgi:hypothetical protein
MMFFQHIARAFLMSLGTLLAAATAGHAATEAASEEPSRARLAIVIGNSDYLSNRYDDLPNAKNDAAALSDSLKRLNFEVATGIDLTAEQTEELLRKYEPRLNEFSAVLIFYAGHGIQFRGENFLLPVDTLDPDSAERLIERATRLNDVINRFASRDRQTFVFLDACRNNPLAGAAPDMGSGLAQVEVGENTFVAFATQPGNVTVDGSGSNSPFTRSLLQYVELPGLSISDLMIRVRNETEKLTLGSQVPWDQSNLREQFYFTEQQVLDSRELSATLNRILEVPSMKEQLLVQLASADGDLQSAVLLLGQQLSAGTVRSVDVKDQSGTQVASLQQPEGTRNDVKSDIEQLLVLGTSAGSATQDAKPALDLNNQVQKELARVGCYRQSVDGVWGPGSRKALSDYLRRTKQEADALEPSVALLSDLFLRSGRICKQPVAAPKPVRTVRAQQDDGGSDTKASRSKKSGGKARSERKKPAAPPPDIGAGIGIGGVF